MHKISVACTAGDFTGTLFEEREVETNGGDKLLLDVLQVPEY